MKFLEVYEHQAVRLDQVISPDSQSDQSVGDIRLTQKHLDAMIKFNEQQKATYFRPIHQGIKFTQYVGTFQIDDLRITVHPKVSKQGNKEDWSKVLPHMLKHTRQIKINSFEKVMAKPEELDLIELYFENYLSELELLITRGLVKRYRKQESNQPCLKGKLLFNQHIKHNLVHKERFYTAHTVYDSKHKIHQIFAEALEVIRLHNRSQSYLSRVRRTQERMPELPRLKVTPALLKSIKLDRKTTHYRECFDLAKLILLNLSPSLNDGQTQVLGFMFDMNKLWERYILTCLEHVYRDKEAGSINITKPLGQSSIKFWQDRTLRPDIVLTYEKGESEKTTCVIDTKWKSLASKTVAIEDIRQMFAYHFYFDAQKTLLLYPQSRDKNETEYDFKPYHGQTDKELAVGELSIFDDSESGAFKPYAPKDLGIKLLEKMGIIDKAI